MNRKFLDICKQLNAKTEISAMRMESDFEFVRLLLQE